MGLSNCNYYLDKENSAVVIGNNVPLKTHTLIEDWFSMKSCSFKKIKNSQNYRDNINLLSMKLIIL